MKTHADDLRNGRIDGSDHSSLAVIDRKGGSLPKGNAVAISAGLLGLSALGGFEREGFSYRHCFQDMWAVVALVSGEGEAESAGRTFALSPGTIFVIPPGLPFCERNTGDCAWGFACMLLNLEDAAAIAYLPKDRPTFFDGGFEVVGKISEVIDALHFRKPGFELKAIGGTIMVMAFIIERTNSLGNTTNGKSVSKAIEILKENICNPPSVPQLAKRCNVSVSLLSHQFKKETGFSPMEYIRRERVKIAKELLLSGSSVEESSTRLGFKSPFHLSRVFSQIEGKPPIFFRKLSRKECN